MASYLILEYYLIFPKIIEYFAFLFLGIRMYRSKDYILNKIYGIAFISWTFYTLSDIIIWTHAADSEFMFTFANIVRDIQIFIAFFYAFLIYLSTKIIYNGEVVIKKPSVILTAFVFLILSLILIHYDTLYITDGENTVLTTPEQWESAEYVIVQTNISLLTAIIIITPLFLYMRSIYLIGNLIHTRIKEKELKKRMEYLLLGITLIPSGVVWFIIILGIPGIYNFWTALFGRMLWVISPFFIWKSQQKKQEKSNEIKKVEKDEKTIN